MIKQCKSIRPIHQMRTRLIFRPIIQFTISVQSHLAHQQSKITHLKNFCNIAAQIIPKPNTTANPKEEKKKTYARETYQFIECKNPAPPNRKGEARKMDRKSRTENGYLEY